MTSLTTALELWLKFQCQMQHKVTQAILASRDSNGQYQLLAHWPAGQEIPPSYIDAFNEVSRKQRIHLIKTDAHHLLLGQPIIIKGKFFGAVVINITDATSQDTKHAVELLGHSLVWLQYILHEHSINAVPVITAPAMPAAQSPLIERLLTENSLQETAISLVNLLATQLQCSRVSLGWKTSDSMSLEAVSFSANFDKRTPAMQILLDAMNEASDQGMNISISNQDGSPEPQTATQIKRNHQQLLAQQNLHSLHSFLLRKDKRIVGVIVLEKSLPAELSQDQINFIQSQLPLISQILELKKAATASLTHRAKHITLTKLHQWFGIQESMVKFASIVTVSCLAVLFIPMNYHVSADASLKSTFKHVLVSPQDGYLKSINVRPGDAVKKGDLLAQLNDDELGLQYRKISSQMQQYQQEYDTALANSNRVAAAISNTQVDQASIQLRLIEQQLERIHLLAPSDGIIVSDDISQSLGAPVKQGDMLFEIAAAKGYVVQLLVDERDIATLKKDQRGQVKLTSLPHKVFDFTVSKITPLSEIVNGRNYFKVDANLTGDAKILRPGMTGTGKINVGKRSLGWIWFHDIWHWLSLKLWW